MDKLETRTTVGRLIQAPLQAEVSIQGKNIILGLTNQTTKRGIEVAFSPLALEELVDIMHQAIRVSRGQGS